MVITIVAVLALVAGATVAWQIAGQMRHEADDRFDAHAASVAAAVQDTMDRASSDIRLARRDETFELALLRSDGPLPLLDRLAVEKAITYLGDRYQVDEICVIRDTGLEAARWVNGKGVAPLEDLSPDERTNNPAVVPTLELADDAFYQTKPYVSADSGRWVIGVATPIISASGAHLGVLHMEIPIAKFASVMAALGYGGDSYNVLLDSDGHLLVHPELAAFRAAANAGTDPDTAPFPMATAGGSPSWRDAVGRMVAEPSGAAEFTDGGRTLRVSWQSIPGADRIVAAVVPTTQLYADADRMIMNLGLTAGPLVLLMILVSAWFARRMATAYSGLSGLNDRLELTNQALEETSRASTEVARESAIVNQFTELTALTEDDVALSAATLATLDELVHPSDALLHVSNQSQDRAVTQAALGGRKPDVLSLHELGRCPAVRRSSLYVTDDVAARLAYRCPVYRVDAGTLACVPLVALGETVGSVHLHWAERRELSLEMRLALTRVSEHAALSLANRRLLQALRGQANTDGRTGLTNSRAFDELVQRRLQQSESGKAAVLMLDLDHFKDFNDRYGHPAGDEALRVFAHILGSSIREHDVAARYGGEEFAVYLSGLDESAAQEVAERIRERTESTIIPIGPGKTGRLTVSIGIAVAPDDGDERSMILKAADAALYRAKLAGRNRVVSRQEVLEPGSPRARPARATRASHAPRSAEPGASGAAERDEQAAAS
ncbi:MAG TPA: diguanylate cyclase [Candidatus Limnocylindrales bacterium]|nr:diguanylate cyclase [Candidatus Limnocylindrales bacterium]